MANQIRNNFSCMPIPFTHRRTLSSRTRIINQIGPVHLTRMTADLSQYNPQRILKPAGFDQRYQHCRVSFEDFIKEPSPLIGGSQQQIQARPKIKVWPSRGILSMFRTAKVGRSVLIHTTVDLAQYNPRLIRRLEGCQI